MPLHRVGSPSYKKKCKSKIIILLLLMVRRINIDKGPAWVMDNFIPFCNTMGLEVEDREMELFALMASLEANKKAS